MISIMHKITGEVLRQVEGDTLVGAELSDANLTHADLTGATLFDANLSGVNLTHADLTGADLSGADLYGADLTHADLTDADLSHADLTGADLFDANLSSANLSSANLAGANLAGAFLAETGFARCETLSQTVGLAEAKHLGPSPLDLYTLRACVSDLPDIFLQGCGYSQDEIQNLRAMYSQTIQFYSCFLSHTEADAEFTDRLRADLLANVTCWHYRYDIPTGTYWREGISETIRVYDKLVLVCSQDSLVRKGVVEEIVEAMSHQQGKRLKLFPIRLDDFILGPEIDAFAREQVARGEWETNWLPKVRAIQMADFRGWKDHDTYRAAFDRLLRDLKNPGER